ncbi:MAG: hypothetical protein JKX97_08750 [Candidatus Lindowbacteria bacterium]|nr:hypothetical protein [Candidatus Lindowbacteria bacterium]
MKIRRFVLVFVVGLLLSAVVLIPGVRARQAEVFEAQSRANYSSAQSLLADSQPVSALHMITISRSPKANSISRDSWINLEIQANTQLKYAKRLKNLFYKYPRLVLSNDKAARLITRI